MRGVSVVFPAMVAGGLGLLVLLYPSLPPEMLNHVNPSVPSHMPRWLWVGMQASLLVALVPLYAGLRREGVFWGVVWREHRNWFELVFWLAAGVVGFWSVVFEIPAVVPLHVPEGVFWSGVTVPFLVYAAALLTRPWAPSLWPVVREDQRVEWIHTVGRTGRLYAALAIASLALYYCVGADATWVVGLLWVVLWRYLSYRHDTMRAQGERKGA